MRRWRGTEIKENQHRQRAHLLSVSHRFIYFCTDTSIYLLSRVIFICIYDFIHFSWLVSIFTSLFAIAASSIYFPKLIFFLYAFLLQEAKCIYRITYELII